MRTRRKTVAMLGEIAITRRPKKENVYSQLFPLIDACIDGQGPLPVSRLAEAMTSADFALAIMEFVDRALWPSYTRMEFNFRPLVFNDTVSNFLTVSRYQRQAGVEDLEMVREMQPAGEGSVPDARKLNYRVYRWEKTFSFSMEAIVNDDLGYFNQMSDMMGDAARRTLEKFVSRLYFNTTTIAALQALGALYYSTARFSTNALMVAWAQFLQRLDTRGEPIETTPIYLIHHKALLPTVQQVLRSVQVAENNTNALNVLPPLTPISDPYMTATGGNPANLPWALSVRPNTGGIRPITLVRLQGRPGPLILSKTPDTQIFAGFGGAGGIVPGLGDFETGSIRLKVADIWGGWNDATYAGLTDFRGFHFSTGETA